MAGHGALGEEQRGRHLAVRSVLPRPRAATRCSAAVSPSARVRPPISAQLPASLLRPAGGPERLEPFERGLDCLAGGALLRARRLTIPSARRARARPNGSPTRSCSRTASSSSETACSTSPAAEAASPGTGTTWASAQPRPSRVASAAHSSSELRLPPEPDRARAAPRRGRRSPRPHHRFKPDPGRNLVGLRNERAASDASPPQSAAKPSDRLDRGETQTRSGGQSGSVLGEPASALELAAMKRR